MCVSCIDLCIAILLPCRLVFRLGKKFWISHSFSTSITIVFKVAPIFQAVSYVENLCVMKYLHVTTPKEDLLNISIA